MILAMQAMRAIPQAMRRTPVTQAATTNQAIVLEAAIQQAKTAATLPATTNLLTLLIAVNLSAFF